MEWRTAWGARIPEQRTLLALISQKDRPRVSMVKPFEKRGAPLTALLETHMTTVALESKGVSPR